MAFRGFSNIRRSGTLAIYLTVICFHVSFISSAQPGNGQQAIIGSFESRIETDLKTDNLHGSMSGAIIKENTIIWSKAFGYANREKPDPANTNTIYRIGSVTKTFTAFLMMELVQEGIIQLDDPVENYLPEIRRLKDYSGNNKITFRQLASHTAGLYVEPDMEHADAGPTGEWENKVLECIPQTRMIGKPGEQFSYSNIGFAILGLALSRASGKSYLKMIQDKIFKPLHMTSSYFIVPDNKMPALAQGMDNRRYKKINTEIPEKEHLGRGYKVPNGGIYSTPDDMAKFMMCLMGYPPRLLSDENLDIMQHPMMINNKPDEYGLGLINKEFNSSSVVGHSGGVPGYVAIFYFNKKCGYGVILMRNYNEGATRMDIVGAELLQRLDE